MRYVESPVVKRKLEGRILTDPRDLRLAQALRATLRLLIAHLEGLERERLERSVMTQMESTGSTDQAVIEGLNGADGQRRGQWVLMQVDWKDVEEVEWQARELASAHKLSGDFAWTREMGLVAEALSAFDAWLRARRHVYLHLDLGDNGYWGFVVPMARQGDLVRLARDAGLTLRSDEEFSALQAALAPLEDELTRMIRQGIRPEGLRERLRLVVGKLLGHVPMGVDAPNKTVRKAIGGGYELLDLLKFGFLGTILSSMGLLFLAVSLTDWNWTGLGVGMGSTALGVWSLRSARTAFRRLRSISRA